jgi:hypothetical protein
MRRSIYAIVLVVLASTLVTSAAFAGAKLQINDDSSLDLGFRAQFLALGTQTDLDGDGKWDNTQDLKIRRARFRLKLVVNEWAEGFLQTDVTGTSGTGADVRMIDAFVNMKAHKKWAQVITGINMVPANRQNLTSSGTLMAIDRPGIAYKSLTWGTRGLYAFSNSTIGMADSGIRGEVDVRDIGVTLFGSGEVAENVSIKYYAGAYDGIQGIDPEDYPGMDVVKTDDERFAGRVQINFFDAEGGYYNSSTYLGKKKTVGVGASVDMQKSVAADTLGEAVDYMYFSGDAFCEWPVGDASVTVEGGFSMLDFDDAIMGTASDPTDLKAVQGTGFYAQGGVLVAEKWQPWGEFEMWSSDDDNDVGSYKIFRIGVTYFLQGHNANIKAGFESMQSDVDLTPEEDTVNSFVIGTYLTY